MFARRQFTPQRPHPLLFTRDYAAQFERWAGYRLHPHARRVVAFIERQRARRQTQRVIVCNDPASTDILRATLADYIRWRAAVVQPGDPFCVVGRNRADIHRILPKRKLSVLPDPRWQPILVSSRTPDHCRGLNFRLALILDGDCFPHRGRALEQHWRAILPAIDLGPHSLLIICGSYRPRTRVNYFSRLVRQARLPVLDLGSPPEESAGKPAAAEAPQSLPVMMIPPLGRSPSPQPFSPPRQAFLS